MKMLEKALSSVLDARAAMRLWFKRPSLTIAIIATLALGIGANTAIFSVTDMILFRPFPVKTPDQLFRIFSSNDQGQELSSSSYPVFADYRDQAVSFSGIAAFSDWNAVHIATGNQKPDRVYAGLVSGNYFELLGVRPALGRLLTPADDRVPGAHPVAVLSFHYWKQHFGASNSIVGSTIRINGAPYTIVGVASPDFFGIGLEMISQIWLPMMMTEQAQPDFPGILTDRRISWLHIIGRVRDGVTTGEAQTELRTIAARRARSQTTHPDPSATLMGLRQAAIGWDLNPAVPTISRMLFAVVLLLLFIACAVCAGLFLIRAEQRKKEIAIRMAIGASRKRLILQLMVESLILAVVAGAAGFLVANWCADLLISYASPNLSFPLEAATPLVNLRVISFTFLSTMLVAVLFGLIPAIFATRLAPSAWLKGEQSRMNLPFFHFHLRDLLVVAQIALAALLLAGAGLLLRSLWKANQVDPGFNPSGTIVASIDVSKHGYTPESGKVFYDQLLTNLQSSTEFTSVSLGRTVPVQQSGMRISFKVEGYNPVSEENPHVDYNIVTPGFFKTLGIPIIAGRDFNNLDRDNAPAVVIINETLAKQIWPGQNPLGKVFLDIGPENSASTVVGVAADVRYRTLRAPADPMIYVPFAQSYMSSMSVLVRSEDSASKLPLLVSSVEKLNKEIPLYKVQTLEEKLALSLAQERMVTMLIGSFAVLALILAGAGLYAVVSHSTQLRTREFGIRMALGALRKDVLLMVLLRGILMVLFGLLIGTSAALIATRLIQSLLFGVESSDPFTYSIIVVILLKASTVASLLPAWKAMKINPVQALHYE